MENKEIIGIGCDQGGFELKQFLLSNINELGYDYKDFGSYTPESIDYPDVAHAVANAVESGEIKRAVLICGSGNGISMAANKHKGIRAAICWNTEIAALARQHNDANIISLPGRFISKEDALACIKIFLSTPFEGGRHQRRVEKIPVL